MFYAGRMHLRLTLFSVVTEHLGSTAAPPGVRSHHGQHLLGNSWSSPHSGRPGCDLSVDRFLSLAAVEQLLSAWPADRTGGSAVPMDAPVFAKARVLLIQAGA